MTGRVSSVAPAGGQTPAGELQLLEASKEGLVEELGTLGGRHGPVRALRISVYTRDATTYSAGSVGVSPMIARTTESVLMPSASPSKFRMIRCRSAGAAIAWTSE